MLPLTQKCFKLSIILELFTQRQIKDFCPIGRLKFVEYLQHFHHKFQESVHVNPLQYRDEKDIFP